MLCETLVSIARGNRFLERNLPPVVGIEIGRCSGQIKPVVGVTSCVALGWETLRLAQLVVVVGNGLLLGKHVGRFDHGCDQAGFNVPLDVAMEQEDTWVVGLEAQHNVAASVDLNCVTTRRYFGNFDFLWVVGSIGIRAGNDLEGVAVEMPWMMAAIAVD